MKKCLSVMVITIILFSFGACKKKEEQPVPQLPARQGPIIETPATIPSQKTEFQVVIPPEIKDQWSAVKLLVEDKKLNKKQEFIVKLGSELKIPDSKLTIKVGAFLPDFKMGAQVITSASNNPNNPAVGVTISEDGLQIFPKSGKWGWLYLNFPDAHSFQHNRFRVLLKEGIAK